MTYLSHLARARRRRLHALMATNDSLRFFAAFIPGGVHTMIALARLSTDEKVRQVAFAWNALPRREHRRVNLDQLCGNAGLTSTDVLGAVVDTACELGMGNSVSELLDAIVALPSAIEAEVARAMTGSWRGRERFFRSVGLLPSPNAAGQRDAYDPNSGLESIEQETMDFTRKLKESMRRQLQWEGSR